MSYTHVVNLIGKLFKLPLQRYAIHLDQTKIPVSARFCPFVLAQGILDESFLKPVSLSISKTTGDTGVKFGTHIYGTDMSQC